MKGELQAWVSTQKAAGYTDEQIIKCMIAHGYSSEMAESMVVQSAQSAVRWSRVGVTALILVLGVFVSLAFLDGESSPSGLATSTVPATVQDIAETTCISSNCFLTNLQSCSPATYRETFPTGVIRQQDIVGREDGGCRISTRYEQHPLADELSMSCIYDMHTTSIHPLERPRGCEGELYGSISRLNSQEDGTQLQLDIQLASAVFKTTDLVAGEYSLEYAGVPYKAKILYGYEKQGSQRFWSATAGSIKPGSFDDEMRILSMQLHAFSVKNGRYGGVADSFSEEGMYTYMIAVYDCATIDAVFPEVQCGRGIELSSIYEWVPPVKEVQRTVKVSDAKPVYACLLSDECVLPCTNCRERTQVCEQGASTCVDCFIDTHCSTGYVCQKNSCVTAS